MPTANKKRPAADKVATENITPGAGGVRIDAARYRAVRKAILEAVPPKSRQPDGIPFKDLPGAVRRLLPGGAIPGGGSISWYVTTVKLDLEAKGLIARIPRSSPQRLVRAPRGARRA